MSDLFNPDAQIFDGKKIMEKADILCQAQSFSEALPHYRKAAEFFKKESNISDYIQAQRRAGEVMCVLGLYPEGESLLDECLTEAQELQYTAKIVELLELRGDIAAGKGDVDSATRFYQAAIEQQVTAGALGSVAEIWLKIAKLLSTNQRYQEARTTVVTLLSKTAEDNLTAQANLHSYLAEIDHSRGDLYGASTHLEQAIAAARIGGNTTNLLDFLQWLGTVEYDKCDLDSALQTCEQGAKIAEEKGVIPRAIRFRELMFSILQKTGDQNRLAEQQAEIERLTLGTPILSSHTYPGQDSGSGSGGGNTRQMNTESSKNITEGGPRIQQFQGKPENSVELKRVVMVKAIVTEAFKNNLVRELERTLDNEKQKLFQIGQNPDTEARINELTNQIGKAKQLILGTEFVQGPLEGPVIVSVGDNLYRKVGGAEIIVKDGVIVKIKNAD